MVKVGILGTGFGENHAKLYQIIEGYEVVSIFGRNEDKLQRIKDQMNIHTTTDINDILRDPEIDLIDICLPTELHSQWAIEGLKNGKHIFCGTPFSYSVEEAEEVQKAAVEYGKNVYVDMFIKFGSAHQTAIRLMKQRDLGNLCSLRSYNQTSPRWGDLSIRKNIETFHIHNIDFMCGVMGMPESVTASAMNFGTKSLVTSAFYDPNKIAVLESGSHMQSCRPFDIGFELVFENGVIRYDATYGEFSREEFAVFENGKPREALTLDGKDDYEECFRHVLYCLNNNVKSEMIDISHAVNTVRIMDMVINSFE